MKTNTFFTFSLLKTLMLTLLASCMIFSSAFAGWNEGVAAFTSKNYKLAAKEFKAVVKENPESWRGHYMLGLSLNILGQASSSEQFRKAYDLNPNDLSIKSALRRFLKTTGDIQNAAFQYMYGTTALKLGMEEDGQQALKKASELDPKNREYQKAASGRH